MKVLLVLSLSIVSFAVSAVTPATFEESKASTLKSMEYKINVEKNQAFVKAKACVEAAKAQSEIQNCINQMRSTPANE